MVKNFTFLELTLRKDKESSMNLVAHQSQELSGPLNNSTKSSEQITKNLRNMSDHELICLMDKLAKEERELLTVVLRHLREIEFRRLFSDLGFTSLFDYAVRRLGYSHDQAARRIAAMRLIKSMPEVEEKIASGALNLTNAAAAHNFFQKQKRNERHQNASFSGVEKINGKSPEKSPEKLTDSAEKRSSTPSTFQSLLTQEAKSQIITQLENTSTREAEKIIAGLTPQSQTKDRIKVVGQREVEIRFTASVELEEKINQLKGLIAHAHPNMALGELINKLADLGLKAWNPGKPLKRKPAKNHMVQKNGTAESSDQIKSGLLGATQLKSDPKKGPEKPLPEALPEAQNTSCGQSSPNEKKQKVPIGKVKRRHLSMALRRHIWRRDGGKCGGCGSKHALEVDHQIPVALGGTHTVENLRLLCRTCNQRAAIKALGVMRMAKYLSAFNTSTNLL
jgi:HNH endonuclease